MMTKNDLYAVSFWMTVLAACGGADDSDEALASAQAASRGTYTSALSASATAAPLSASGAVDATRTAEATADAIAAQLASKISGCAGASVAHGAGTATLSVNFGSGCSVAGYGTLSGSLQLTVSKTTALNLAFVFSSFAVNGVTVNGSLGASTSDGKTYALTEDLQVQAGAVKGSGTAVLDAGGKGLSLTGAGSFTASGVAAPYETAALHHLFGGCYADAGTVTVTETITPRVGGSKTVQTVMAFLATTPSTGQVTVTTAGKTATKTLPAYGACPTT